MVQELVQDRQEEGRAHPFAGVSTAEVEYQQLVELMSASQNHEVLKDGAKLGQQLAELNQGETNKGDARVSHGISRLIHRLIRRKFDCGMISSLLTDGCGSAPLLQTARLIDTRPLFFITFVLYDQAM